MDDLGQPTLDQETVALLAAGMRTITDKTPTQAMRLKGDRLIVEFVKSIQSLEE
jgi:hypothetical protein